MGYVYHGSKKHNIERLEPRKSTHGEYVYATNDKVLALIFSGRCGDDLTYSVGRYGANPDEPWDLVEVIPHAFDKMFSNSSSIYSFSDKTFRDIHTGFNEVVSDIGVDVIKEEVIDNVYDELLNAEKEGLVRIYRYPNRPKSMEKDNNYILDKWRFYKTELHRDFTREEFDRLAYLHPELLDEINNLSKEMGYDYSYNPEDLIDIFKLRIAWQLSDSNHEQYIESSYISICDSSPELKEKLDLLYNFYNENLTKNSDERKKQLESIFCDLKEDADEEYTKKNYT